MSRRHRVYVSPRLLVWACLLLLAAHLPAIDINPSKSTVPERFYNPPGSKRFDPFAGDPKRVQRANEVKLEDFQATLTAKPNTISLSGSNITLPSPAAAEEGVVETPASTLSGEGLEITFLIQNKNPKRSYTLNFPDSQRFDIAIGKSLESPDYLWSGDKKFLEEAGASFVNPGESIAFREVISLDVLKQKLKPGTYKIFMVLSNYPEIQAQADLTIQP
jgi:hypothetical protein